MLATHSTASTQLLDHRNKAVAKSFYRQLRGEGFSHEQIIELCQLVTAHERKLEKELEEAIR